MFLSKLKKSSHLNFGSTTELFLSKSGQLSPRRRHPANPRAYLRVERLEERIVLDSGPSTIGHITDGKFDIINGRTEWSDIPPTVFSATQSYLYADQANLNGPPGARPDTFMLMYDQVGQTTALTANQFVPVKFTTVENEPDGTHHLNFYEVHLFTDGTITFLENGAVQRDANGNARVTTLGGQMGKVGFGPSPNSSVPHVIAEFQIALSPTNNGGYSPDPQFWSSDPTPPPPPAPKAYSPQQKTTLGTISSSLNILAATAATVTCAVAELPSALASTVCFVGGVAWMGSAITDFLDRDPSDPNFTVIAQPNAPTIPPVSASSTVTQAEATAFNSLFTNQRQMIGFGQAAVTSFNRAQGAFDAGDPFWEQQQINAAQQYALQMAPFFGAESNLLVNLKNAIQAAGLNALQAAGVPSTFTATDVSNFQAMVRTNGLPSMIQQELTQLGADSTTQTDVRQLFLSLDPNVAAAFGGGKFPDILTDPSLTSALNAVATAFGVVQPGAGAVLPGFNFSILPANDDGSTGLVPLGFTANFFGNNYSSVYVNNNGNITFDSPLSEFTPFGLTATSRVIIAPFFADVDTTIGNVVTYGSGTVDGHPAFGVEWPGVGYYQAHTNKLNVFQVVLVDRSDTGPGNFDIEFNYNQIQWETGDASGGVNGLGGDSARVGFSNGSGQAGTSFELPGSAVNGAFLDSNTTTGLVHNSIGSSQLGRYVFSIRSGVQQIHSTAAFLQANLSGTTHVEATSLLVSQEPTLTQRLVRIVQFRLQAGLISSATAFTTELVNGLVQDGLVSSQAANQLISTVVGQITVQDAALHVRSTPISPIAGAPFSGVVASFTDDDPAGTLSQYSATITWGDGSTSAGTIASNGSGGFNVTASHTYASVHKDTVTILVKDVGGSMASDISSFTIGVLGSYSTAKQNATINFWAGSHGQALLDSFNGGPTSTALATWLATSFPNLYGARAGVNNLTGKTNAQVAALFLTFYAEARPKPDAQALALALNIYASTSSLGGTAGAALGFSVTSTGLGASFVSLGTNGAAFDAPNNVPVTAYYLLYAANAHAVNGVLYNGNTALVQEFLNVVVALNDTGMNG